MSNNETRPYSNSGPYETGESSRDCSRADSSGSSTSAKSKDQTAPEGASGSIEDLESDNCSEGGEFLIASQKSKIDVYHADDADDIEQGDA
jgi:hypothetical protein